MQAFECVVYYIVPNETTMGAKRIRVVKFLVDSEELANQWKAAYEESIEICRNIDLPKFTNGSDEELDHYLELKHLRDRAYSFCECKIVPTNNPTGRSVLIALPNDVEI